MPPPLLRPRWSRQKQQLKKHAGARAAHLLQVALARLLLQPLRVAARALSCTPHWLPPRPGRGAACMLRSRDLAGGWLAGWLATCRRQSTARFKLTAARNREQAGDEPHTK